MVISELKSVPQMRRESEEREQKLGLLNLTEESVRTNIPPQSEIEQVAGDIQEALTAEWSIEMT